MTQIQAGLLVLWPSWIVHTVFIGRTALSVVAVLSSLAIWFNLLNVKGTAKRPELWFGLAVCIPLVCILRIHEIAYFIPILALGLFDRINRLKKATYMRPLLYGFAALMATPIVIGVLNFYQQLVGEGVSRV